MKKYTIGEKEVAKMLEVSVPLLRDTIGWDCYRNLAKRIDSRIKKAEKLVVWDVLEEAKNVSVGDAEKYVSDVYGSKPKNILVR